MSKREINLLVGDILDSARKILDYTASLNFEDFTKDSKTIDAVIRNLRLSEKQLSAFLKSTGIGFPT